MAGVGRLLVDPVLSARAQKISRRAHMLSDPDLRQHSHVGLNKGEASNSVRRAVFFHRQGEIRDRTFENQSFRASGLSLTTAEQNLRGRTGSPTAFVASSGDRVILEGGRAMRAAAREEG